MPVCHVLYIISRYGLWKFGLLFQWIGFTIWDQVQNCTTFLSEIFCLLNLRENCDPGSSFRCKTIGVNWFLSDFFFSPLFLTEHWLLADLADDQPSMMVSVDYWQHPGKRMRSKNREIQNIVRIAKACHYLLWVTNIDKNVIIFIGILTSNVIELVIFIQTTVIIVYRC